MQTKGRRVKKQHLSLWRECPGCDAGKHVSALLRAAYCSIFMMTSSTSSSGVYHVLLGRRATTDDARIKEHISNSEMTIIRRNDTSGGITGADAVSPEPVLPSPTLLIVRMRDVESDWSAAGDTQKRTNQSAEQIQVVNPEPAFACTARSSRR